MFLYCYKCTISLFFFPVLGWDIKCLSEKLVVSSNGKVESCGVLIRSSTAMSKCWQKDRNWLQDCHSSWRSQALINQSFSWLTQKSVFQYHKPPGILSQSPQISQATLAHSWLVPSFLKAQVLESYINVNVNHLLYYQAAFQYSSKGNSILYI